MADNLSLSYGGETLSDTQVRYIVKRVVDKLNCPPSFPIVCFFSESRWGTSTVGQSCNNWAGMSYLGSKNTIKRDSGVTCYKCLSRPSGEGGAYFGYDTFGDFLTDWIYLFRRQGNYRVYGKKPFSETVKGMFKYGGANYDYAVYGNNSKTNYENYFALLNGVRNGINSNNDNLLTKLDNGTIDWGDDPPNWEQEYPDDDDDDENIINILKNLINSSRNEIGKVAQEIIEALLAVSNSNAYDFSKQSFGNKNIKVEKMLDNMYIIRTTGQLNETIQTLQNSKSELENENIDKRDEYDNSTDNGGSDVGQKPFHPTNGQGRISSTYGYRGDIGIVGASQYHWAIDIAVPNGTNVYATQEGECVRNEWNDITGWRVRIKHTHPKDKYYTNYQHLRSKSPIAVGETVTRGQKIAESGNTGIGGYHLHFDVSKNGTFYTQADTIDPQKYLKMRF